MLTENINVISAAKLHIAQCKRKPRHKESGVLNFYKEVLVLLVTLTSKFIENSPIKGAVVRFTMCFDSNNMANIQNSAIKTLWLLCEKVLTWQRVPSTKYVEEAKEQY